MSPSSRLVLIAACLSLVAACSSSSSGRNGVAVRSLNTNVGLGIDVGANTAPANTAVVERSRGQENPNQILPTFQPPPFPYEQAAPKLKCPSAGPFDFPSEEAGVQAKGRPVAATYPWKLDGQADIGGGPNKVDTSETRQIKDIADDSGGPGAFDYSQTQTYLIDQRQHGVLTTTFRVVPNSRAQTRQTNSDVGRGIFLVSIRFDGKDADGHDSHTVFTPQPSVQMMAFPVVQGAGVAGSTPQTGTPITRSSGTDPSTGNSLTLEGNVFAKKQVDACGKKIDTWLMKTTETYTYNNSRNGQTNTLESTYNYAFALQYGGLLAYEHTEAPKDAPVIVLDARIGRVPMSKG